MQKFIHSCINMQASTQECRRALGRIVRKYPAEKWGMLPSWRELRRLIRPWLAELSAMVAAGLASLDRRRNFQVQRLALVASAGGLCARGCDPPRVNRVRVAALVVCVQDSKQDSAQDNVCSVGVLRLLSMRIGNTSNSKAARLYALRLCVTRCIYGRTYGALLFARGIGGHNGRSIVHALLLHALTVCQRACNIGHRGI